MLAINEWQAYSRICLPSMSGDWTSWSSWRRRFSLTPTRLHLRCPAPNILCCFIVLLLVPELVIQPACCVSVCNKYLVCVRLGLTSVVGSRAGYCLSALFLGSWVWTSLHSCLLRCCVVLLIESRTRGAFYLKKINEWRWSPKPDPSLDWRHLAVVDKLFTFG
jgi:hypothetical protein